MKATARVRAARRRAMRKTAYRKHGLRLTAHQRQVARELWALMGGGDYAAIERQVAEAGFRRNARRKRNPIDDATYRALSAIARRETSDPDIVHEAATATMLRYADLPVGRLRQLVRKITRRMLWKAKRSRGPQLATDLDPAWRDVELDPLLTMVAESAAGHVRRREIVEQLQKQRRYARHEKYVKRIGDLTPEQQVEVRTRKRLESERDRRAKGIMPRAPGIQAAPKRRAAMVLAHAQIHRARAAIRKLPGRRDDPRTVAKLLKLEARIAAAEAKLAAARTMRNPQLWILHNPNSLAAARAAFARFHGYDQPKLRRLPPGYPNLVAMGEQKETIYQPRKGGRRGPAFYHTFGRGAVLASTPDGSRLFVVPARKRPFRVHWDRGIVG